MRRCGFSVSLSLASSLVVGSCLELLFATGVWFGKEFEMSLLGFFSPFLLGKVYGVSPSVSFNSFKSKV